MRRSVHVWKVLSPCRTGARATKRHQTERPIIRDATDNRDMGVAWRQVALGTDNAS